MRDEILNLANLKYFCDAIRLGGLSAAAKENFVTQSAISQAISKLEKSLGVPLLAHHPNRLRPTSQGLSVFNDAIVLLKQIGQFQQNSSQTESPQMGNLEFACTHSFSLAVVPCSLKEISRRALRCKSKFLFGPKMTPLFSWSKMEQWILGSCPWKYAVISNASSTKTI